MDRPALHGKRLLAAAVFVAATLVLAVQLINPSPVVVSVGENGAQTDELGQYFTYSDVGTIAGAALLVGATGTYILTGPTAARSEPSARQSGSTDSRGVTAPATPADGVVEDGGSTAATFSVEQQEREEWETAHEGLYGNEKTVYGVVLDADGKLPQRDIVERTDLSKATVSRTLDTLESKRLVERKRRGMGNVVVLQ
ncbi:MarR family transcriptional regulator [Salinarchaeum sp. Harcht-Bsk1]|uniref:helix-turn-helix transcriptional regulator n=1 Tax=Salinarchaeum sp. Harcht-Bsk1 TaxID=1333523 RepID=UPI0003424014|nr:MarR family transcriptional regulator [Salinarchaeum sp. Harcht-Bsk1]AGN02071.1 MarR family transcriptional regulator [Salinarchaeum sp. Harcht-Bsk1]